MDRIDTKLGLLRATLMLLSIGFARNAFEVAFNINDGGGAWYSFRYDIVFVMMMYPLFLCFFTFLLVCEVGRWLGLALPKKQTFLLLYYLQLLHLIIPPLDAVGNYFNLPISYGVVDAAFAIPGFFEPVLGITFGILIAWAVAVLAFLIFFLKRGEVGWLRGLSLLLVVGNILYWPIYHIYPTFNTLFRWLTFGLVPGLWFGYGLFFCGLGVMGFIYTRKQLVCQRGT